MEPTHAKFKSLVDKIVNSVFKVIVNEPRCLGFGINVMVHLVMLLISSLAFSKDD